jgi:hypothetical protein
MHDTTNTSTELRGCAQHGRQYESLPGQKQLFSERESGPTIAGLFGRAQRRELFETGKDLPGAAETDQSILWDVA